VPARQNVEALQWGDKTMLKSFSRGFDIAAGCWTILKRHPKLMALPALSALAFLALVALFAVTAGITGVHHQHRLMLPGADHGAAGSYAIFFVLYLICVFAIMFFNAALVFCAMQAFAGQEPSIKQGLATAHGRLPQIFLWALVAATIGLLLQALRDFLEDKFGFLAGLTGILGETAWSAATYFVIPVLVVDGVGPVDAVKRSSAILREKWGTAVAGESGIGIVAVVLTLPALLLAGFFMAQGALGLPLAAIAVIYFLAASLAFATLGTLFRTAIYVYATTGQAPGLIREDLIRGAFRDKK
jgi:hypothetical protein